MTKTIDIGSKVYIKMEGECYQYILSHSQESNLAKRKISITSPLGRSLLGKTENFDSNFKLPDGTRVHYRIIRLSN